MEKNKLTFKEMLRRKDFILSTSIEIILFDFARQLGVGKGDLISGLWDAEMGAAKEKIYKQFSKALGFNYKWDGFYRIKDGNK